MRETGRQTWGGSRANARDRTTNLTDCELRSRMLALAPMPTARILVSLVALPFAYACGGDPPPAPVAPATPAPAPVAVAAPAAPDLGAIADPPGLVVSARLGNPGAALAVVRDWSGLPMPGSEEVAQLLVGEAVGPLVDLDQPIDFAVVVAGGGMQVHPLSAVSVALKDVERAKTALAEHYTLAPGDNGVLDLQKNAGAPSPSPSSSPSRAADDDDGDRRRSCAIEPAYGPAPVRLVCGWSPKALSELGPWLTRTATRNTTSSDVHIDVRVRPLHATIAAEKRLIGALLSGGMRPRVNVPSAGELLSSLAEDVTDFSLDLDGASIDLLLRDSATATATLTFSGKTSALTRLATAHPDRNAAAPGVFWQLPGDADFAFFDRGIDEHELTRGRDLLLRVVDDGLAEEGLGAGDRKAIVDAVGKVVTSASSAPLVIATGLDSDASKKALSAEKALGDGSDTTAHDEAERASVEVLTGWQVIEVDEPSATVTAAVKELAAARARPAVAAVFRSKDAPWPALRAAALPKGTTLPPGTQHYVFETPFHGHGRAGATKPSRETAPAARRSIATHVFIAPDGARTWIGIGAGELPVARRLASALAPTGDTLSARAELAPLKSASVGSGGFVTQRALLSPGAAAVIGPAGGAAAAIDKIDELARLQHGGKVAIPFSLTGLSDTQVTANVEVPRAAIEDIVRIVMRHGF
jgi:hypothetical protein